MPDRLAAIRALLNLFAPVLTALVFIHFGLARLAYLRQIS
jgi:hypothetical protein